jgi:hypothetical protein
VGGHFDGYRRCVDHDRYFCDLARGEADPIVDEFSALASGPRGCDVCCTEETASQGFFKTSVPEKQASPVAGNGFVS